MTRSKINIAQLGVGYWGPNLLRNFIQNDNCYVSKVVDLSKERREFVKSKYPEIEVSANAHEVIDDPSIDAIVIATPAGTHYELAKRALEQGKHVLVEKPLATAVSQVDELGSIARKSNLVCMVGHTFLYNSAVRCLKDLIDSGELGQVRYIYSQRLNLGRIRSDIDVLWNLAPHDISIVQYLFGDPHPTSVSLHGMSYVQKGIHDVAFLNLVYPNQLLVNIHVSWLDPSRTRKMIIVGSEKMVIYDDAAEYKIQVVDKGIDRMAVLGENMDYDELIPHFNHRTGGIQVPVIEFAEPLQVEIDHFIDCIQNGTPCLTGIDHARRVIEILCTARPATKVFELIEVQPDQLVSGFKTSQSSTVQSKSS